MERRLLNKSRIHGFLIFISSLVFPCAVMEYNTPIERHVQVWVFPFGAYFQEFRIGGYPTFSQFVMLFSKSYLFLLDIMIVMTSVAIGLILATEVITLQESTDITKKIYVGTILFLLLIIQFGLAIEVAGLGGPLYWANYIIPLPIPLLLAILLLKYKGFRFMRESYFQGFLIFVSSLMLPCAVLGFETNSQEWLFTFGVYYLMFNEHLVRARFFMPFFLEYWFPYFIILGVGWMAIGLALAVEVVKSWERKEFERKAFFISIILLILQIVGPIAAAFLVYDWILVYVIPLPIPFLVTILLLKHRGITIIPFKKLRRHHQNQSVIQN